jgi:hypothetical protein
MSAVATTLASYLLALGDTMRDHEHVMLIGLGEVLPLGSQIYDRLSVVEEVTSLTSRISFDCGRFIIEK